MDQRIGVLGAGSWGTALALVLARNGHPTTLWGRDAPALDRMSATRENSRYLPGERIPAELSITSNLEDAVTGASIVVVAVPSHAFRGVLDSLPRRPGGRISCVWATKGFEPDSGRLLHEVAAAALPADARIAVLSGPTFAREIARGLPAAVTIASPHSAFAAELAALFGAPYLRAYTSDDVIGVEVGGSVKNVLAIAAGIADGLAFGANTRAALIARGLSELMRLGVALGGRGETLMGLAGLGDLVLTCTDDQSRNRRFGLSLATGSGIAEAERAVGQVVEGVSAAAEVMRVARARGLDLPICEQVYRVIYEEVPPVEAVNALLSRSVGRETGGSPSAGGKA